MPHLFAYVEQAFQFLGDQLAIINVSFLAVALLVHAVGKLVGTRAWTNILRHIYPSESIRWRDIATTSLASGAADAIVPFAGGTPLRIFLVKHKYSRTHYPALASSLLLEALFDTVCLVALSLWLLFSGLIPDNLVSWSDLSPLQLLSLLPTPLERILVLIAALAASYLFVRFLRSRQESTTGRLRLFWQQAKQGLGMLSAPLLFTRKVISWQALTRLLQLISIMFFLAAFGLPHGILVALLVVAAQSFSSLIPVPPGDTIMTAAIITFAFAKLTPGTSLTATGVTLLVVVMPTLISALNIGMGLVGF